MTDPIDQDEQQEYHCLILEGFSEKEARKLARSANDRINSRRLSGPITGDTRNGHGQRPLISDMRLYVEDVQSLTMDRRTTEDLEQEQAAAEKVEQVLSWLAPRQRQYIVNKYGIGVEAAASESELADRLGIKIETVKSSLQKVRAKVLAIEAAGGYDNWYAEHMARRYEGGNQGRKRRYQNVTEVTEDSEGRG
jgi:DNA-directed RNA polymerase specialized sigma24 family protein